MRDGDKRIVRLKEGSPAGRHVVIVDDLVQSGGTLIECQSMLAQMGAKHGRGGGWAVGGGERERMMAGEMGVFSLWRQAQGSIVAVSLIGPGAGSW